MSRAASSINNALAGAVGQLHSSGYSRGPTNFPDWTLCPRASCQGRSIPFLGLQQRGGERTGLVSGYQGTRAWTTRQLCLRVEGPSTLTGFLPLHCAACQQRGQWLCLGCPEAGTCPAPHVQSILHGTHTCGFIAAWGHATTHGNSVKSSSPDGHSSVL